MKKPTYYNSYWIILFFFLLSLSGLAQTFVPFTPRQNVEVRGSMLVVGNNSLGQDNLPFNDLTRDNQDISMQYIDIDSDATTFSSSSADLILHTQPDGSPTTCYRVAFAALYWGAIMQDGNRDDIDKVKLKLPGTSTYVDITGEIIYDAIVSPIVAETGEPGNTPYACYAEVTDIISGLTDIEGTYTVGNVTASEGFNNSTGLAAGWTLFVIYEDPNLATKSFTTFDGFSHIFDGHQETIPVSGFRTPPAGNIDLQFAYGALDGDRTKRATKLEINGKEVTTPFRTANKFFGSVIENENGVQHPRDPFSANTLGYDTGFLEIQNAEPEFIRNDDTSGDFRMQVARGQADPIFAFFSAFAVDVISPDIDLLKKVKDVAGDDIDGDDVILGQQLFYEITYQSVGNDDVTQFTIKDVLPDNIIFDPATDIDLSNAGGATLQSWDPATRTLIFDIPDGSVEVGDPAFVIRLAIQVVPDCYDLSQACSNEIRNQAFATYRGVINPTIIEEEGSFATEVCLGVPTSTNFIVDISNCDFTQEEVLCGDSVILTAAAGYDSYSWSTSPSGTPVIGTGQTYTATSTGTYFVTNTTTATCISINETFNVVTYGSDLTNPVIPYADLLPICPNDGKVLPYIFLCGGNESRTINTNISDSVSIIWEQLDDTSCPPVGVDDCANEDDGCTWNEVGTGSDFVADTSGEFRLVINYPGGCFNIFYFNVYQNLLTPTITAEDILCTTPGSVTVGGVPSGYEYSLDGTNFQSSNTFTITTPGYYIVYIRQIGIATNPCIFQTPSIFVRERDFTVTTSVTQPNCNGGFGSIHLAANDALPQYYFSIYESGVLVNSVGPIMQSDYEFTSLNAGNYSVNVTTDDGCTYTEDILIVEPPLLTVTAAITIPLTCTDGEITAYPVGGTPPYQYYFDGATISQDTPNFTVSTPGVYDITVIDFNNCSASTSITVDAISEPTFAVSPNSILCAENPNSGSITISVSNPNGNTLRYSIDNGVTFFNSPVFTGLVAGDYNVVVEYSIGSSVCITAPQLVTISTATPITANVNLTTPYTCTTNGVITVSGVSGGTAPYEYSIDGINYQSSNTFTGLTSGTYTITVRDANNCSFGAAPITIDPLTPPTDLDFSNTPVDCITNTTTVTVTATGGLSPLEYQISAPSTSVTPYQGSNSFSGLLPGTYTFQVRDANDCTYSESFTIAPLAPITVSTVVTKDLDCTATPDGIIQGTISGGTAPYTYAVSFNGGSFTPLGSTGTPFNYTASTAGTYQFQITDVNGCTGESGVQTINPVEAVTAAINDTNPTCSGLNDGSVQIIALTGMPPFTYSIDGGSTFSSTNIFGGLSAGSYNYVVVDNKGCDVSGSVTLSNPASIDVSITRNAIQCNSNIPGSLDVTINSGGTAPYTYSLFDNTFTQVGSSITTTSTTQTFSGLSFGDYYVTIIDANGCEYTSSAQRIETPPNIQLDGNASTGSCATGATVDISVITGAAPYTYSIYGQPATAFGPTASTSHSFTGLNHGTTYQFQVLDSGGCISIIEVTTPVLSPIDITPITPTDVSCHGSDDGSVDFTVVNYDASVTTIYYEVQDQLTNLPIIPAQNGTFTGLSGASVSATITGLAPGNYTLFAQEVDGTLCTISRPFQISEPIQPLLAAAASSENANCNNGAQITINTTGGTAPYLYAAGPLGFIPVAGDFGSNNVLTLDHTIQTNWDIVVRDANGCETRINESIAVDPEPVVAVALNNQCTAIEGNFAIDVTLTATSVGPYSYSIDGGVFQIQTAPFTISNLTSGSHSIEVQDANGCGNLVTIDILPPLEILPSITALATCNDDDGQITLAVNGGSNSYSYSINPSPLSISLSGNVFSGVPSGSYTITVTDLVSNCTADVEVVMPQPITPQINLRSTAVACIGDNSGTISIEVLGGYSGVYNYEIFDGLGASVTTGTADTTVNNPEVVNGFNSDTYQVVITETSNPFCSASANVIVSSPSAVLTIVATETSNVTCDNNSGTITALASGGWGTYEYELTGAATIAYSSNGTFTNLSAGSYTVNARDAGGCIASDPVILNIPPPINASISASPTMLNCFGDTNAVITVSSVTGGQGSNYTYTLNRTLPTLSSSGPQTSNVFSGLGAGTYNVAVTDGFNCSFTTPDVVIDEPTEIQVNLVKDTPLTCNNDATLTLSASGGTGMYEYSDTANFATVLGSFSSQAIFFVSSGSYQYYVRDANGCTSNASNEIIIDSLVPLTVTLDTTNATVNCAGDSTGVIVAEAEGGLGNYIYILQDGGGNTIPGATQNSPGVFTDLPIGTYQVHVDSGDCLSTSSQVTITEPSAPLTETHTVTPVTCTGNDDGVIEIIVTGGTGIIKYAISPQLDQFFEDPIFDNLTAGTYEIIVQDELGCFVTFTETLIDPTPVSIVIVPNSILPEVCEGDMNGEFSIEISGGNLPYSVSLDDINGTYTTGTVTQTQFDFTNLSGGDHIVYVIDALGCESEWNITFPESVVINPDVIVDFGCVNNISSNTVTVTIDDSITNPADVDYSLNGGPYQTSNVFIDVPPGIGHYIDVRHTNGCIQQTPPFDIEAYDPLVLVLENGGLNEIVAVASGGTGDYEFEMNGESFGSENTFRIYESRDYTVTVTDSNGCTAVATGYFEYVDICIPNVFTPDGNNDRDEWAPGCGKLSYPNLTVDIYDRYGRVVARLGVNDTWDGKYNGRELPTGDYWYVINLNDKKDDRDFVGHFTLYR